MSHGDLEVNLSPKLGKWEAYSASAFYHGHFYVRERERSWNIHENLKWHKSI